MDVDRARPAVSMAVRVDVVSRSMALMWRLRSANFPDLVVAHQLKRDVASDDLLQGFRKSSYCFRSPCTMTEVLLPKRYWRPERVPRVVALCSPISKEEGGACLPGVS